MVFDASKDRVSSETMMARLVGLGRRKTAPHIQSRVLLVMLVWSTVRRFKKKNQNKTLVIKATRSPAVAARVTQLVA